MMVYLTLMIRRGNSRSSLLEGDGGFDSKSSHIGSSEGVVKLGGWEQKIDLPSLQFLFYVQGFYVFLIVQAVRIAEEPTDIVVVAISS
ncbi:hypothetical protein LguiA_006989 [Lonicera macranthoides]